MKNLIKNTVTAAAILSVLPVLSFAEGKSIYGDDNRQEYFQLSAARKALADSTVSMWRSASVEAGEGGAVTLKTRSFSEAVGLCPGEPFAEQPVGAFCSGSLVGEDLIMTAGHCVRTEAQCLDTKFVFGYNVGSEGAQATLTQPAANVYGCAKIVKRFLAGEPGSPAPEGQRIGADYALVQLDRKVTGRRPLEINRGKSLKNGDSIFVIGHPVGLPLKLADDATVRDFSKVDFFAANLDTFGGNSGSPVFNARTLKIEGILVRGDEDFAQSPAGCTTMATYAQDGGRGEDVTKIGVLASFIPRLGARQADEEAPAADLAVVDMDSRSIQPVELASRSITFD